MLRTLISLSLLSATVGLSAVSQPSVPEGWFPWPMVEPVAGSALDASSLNPAPAGEAGRIQVKDGAFVTPDGRPLRFLGVNIPGHDAFPSAADAELIATRLSRAGVNIARLHHLDNPWGIGNGGSLWRKEGGRHQELDTEQLDRLHRLIAVLARHGIYTNLNLKVSKTLSPADGFPDSVSQFPDFQKRVDIYDRRMIGLQKDYARRLLTTVNPYTGKCPAEDPAVAVIEINNENSLLGYFTRDLGLGAERFPEPFRGELQALWNAWLARHYKDSAALAAAWNTTAAVAAPILDPAKVSWLPKIQAGSSARVSPGPDASSLAVEVTSTGGSDWHVQLSAHGLRLADNHVYAVSCQVRAAAPSKLGIGVSNDEKGESWRSLGLLQTVQVGTDWTPVRIVFPAHSVGDSPARLSLNVAAQVGSLEFRELRLAECTEGGLLPGQQLGSLPLPTEPSTAQWGDWIAFLAETERGFAEEMRAYLRDELHVKAPMICSQMNFSGLPALDREQSMDFADTHSYWEHPQFPGSGWDRANWTIKNSPMVAVMGPRRFGELGDLAYTRVAGKPFTVSEYDHPAPSEYVCEMYPEMAVFGCRQNWDAIYAFDMGTYGSRNTDGRISSYFDQINHPAKWSLAPFASRVFRGGLVPPASAVAELRPGRPVWGEAMHYDMLWAKINPQDPFDFLDCRLQVSDRPSAGTSTLVRSGAVSASPAWLHKARLGQVFIAHSAQAAVATGFLGGDTVDTGAFTVSCPRFGRDFATVAVVSLDGKPLPQSSRLLLTVVARAENEGMVWNEAHNSLGKDWGHGPTIVERVPASIRLVSERSLHVFALRPDGTHDHEMPVSRDASGVSFGISEKERSLQFELAAE
jgi:hypothetical protein